MNGLSFCSLRFSTFSNRSFTSRGSVSVWSRQSSGISGSRPQVFFSRWWYSGVVLRLLDYKTFRQIVIVEVAYPVLRAGNDTNHPDREGFAQPRLVQAQAQAYGHKHRLIQAVNAAMPSPLRLEMTNISDFSGSKPDSRSCSVIKRVCCKR